MAFAGVLKQTVLAHGGDQNIGEAVIVVIGDSHAHAVHLHRQAGLAGDIRKCSVAVVAIELERGGSALVSGPIHAIDEQNIQPAVAIVIEKRAA